MNQNELSKKWNSLFDRSRDIKIGYVKEQCPICRTKNLKHFLDCKHIEMDLDEIDKRVKKEIGKEMEKGFSKTIRAMQR